MTRRPQTQDDPHGAGRPERGRLAGGLGCSCARGLPPVRRMLLCFRETADRVLTVVNSEMRQISLIDSLTWLADHLNPPFSELHWRHFIFLSKNDQLYKIEPTPQKHRLSVKSELGCFGTPRLWAPPVSANTQQHVRPCVCPSRRGARSPARRWPGPTGQVPVARPAPPPMSESSASSPPEGTLAPSCPSVLVALCCGSPFAEVLIRWSKSPVVKAGFRS